MEEPLSWLPAHCEIGLCVVVDLACLCSGPCTDIVGWTPYTSFVRGDMVFGHRTPSRGRIPGTTVTYTSSKLVRQVAFRDCSQHARLLVYTPSGTQWKGLCRSQVRRGLKRDEGPCDKSPSVGRLCPEGEPFSLLVSMVQGMWRPGWQVACGDGGPVAADHVSPGPPAVRSGFCPTTGAWGLVGTDLLQQP